MAYTDRNFKTKAALKRALLAGETVTCYSPGLGTIPENGTVYLEGPHYPEPHRWYAQATIEAGRVVRVK